ncbi:MAG TPA: hypothetical protein VLC09_08525, partial [Polyangiaceae bacterium]|nr:hypothetical protein [Polyangiaceae bacterium]
GGSLPPGSLTPPAPLVATSVSADTRSGSGDASAVSDTSAASDASAASDSVPPDSLGGGSLSPPPLPRVPGASSSGVNLQTRYSLRAPAFDEDGTNGSDPPPHSKSRAG